MAGDGTRLYNAIATSVRLPPLPQAIVKGYQLQLEGLQVPVTEPVIQASNRIVGNMLAIRGVQDIAKQMQPDASDHFLIYVNAFADYLQQLRVFLDLAAKTSNPAAYLDFLARPGVPLFAFTKGCSVFTSRKIEFTSLPERDVQLGAAIIETLNEKEMQARELLEVLGESSAIYSLIELIRLRYGMDVVDRILEHQLPDVLDKVTGLISHDPEYLFQFAHSGATTYGIFVLKSSKSPTGLELLLFDKKFEAGPLHGYVLVDPTYLRARNARGLAYGFEMLLETDSDRTAQHELQHMFDSVIGIKREDTIEAHVPSEYRARLAELAFSSDPAFVYSRMMVRLENREGILGKLSLGPNPTSLQLHNYNSGFVTVRADRMIKQQFEFTPEPEIRDKAKKLLDEAYSIEVGLPYQAIIQPFS